MTNTPSEWPFDQAPDVAAMTSTQITRKRLPILLVTHQAEGTDLPGLW